MSRWSLVFVVALTACGGAPKATTPPSPLPGESKPEPVGEAKPPAEEKPAEPVAPPKPAGPLDVSIAATTTTVKLVSPGKGKRTALRYAAKAGDKQQLEVALDFTEKHVAPEELGGSDENKLPTIVLVAETETTTADKDGAEFALSVSGADVKETAGAKVPIDKLKTALQGLIGLTIGGKVAANGTAGEIKLHLDKPDEAGPQLLDMVRYTLPPFPALPAEPVGVGAKWQATTTTKVMDQVAVTQVTDYELVGHKGTTWTIKGTTKVSGADQEMKRSKITGIAGSGTSEATLADGTLYPTYKSSLETSFTATEGDKAITFSFKVGGAITPKK
jgi:hypothetical protein